MKSVKDRHIREARAKAGYKAKSSKAKLEDVKNEIEEALTLFADIRRRTRGRGRGRKRYRKRGCEGKKLPRK